MNVKSLLDALSRGTAYLIPLLLCAVGLLMLRGKRPYFDAFLSGARSGLDTAVRLCPTLVALLVATGMLRASGAVEVVGQWLAPLFSTLGADKAEYVAQAVLDICKKFAK